MVDNLQELIHRGRFTMATAPERLKVFEAVDGRRSTEDIANLLKRHVNSIRRDLTILADVGLIQPKAAGDVPVKKNGFPVFEKFPLARAIPIRYFTTPTRSPSTVKARPTFKSAGKSGKNGKQPPILPFPTEQDILAIAKSGEDQIYEFKGPGTEVRKITREIAAMLNTSRGGMILYGVDDAGKIVGSDVAAPKLDQPLQNSVRNSISPSASFKMKAVQVMGSSIIVIVVPPWNKKDVYQHDERVWIRRGSNAFPAKPDELKSLHLGKPVT